MKVGGEIGRRIDVTVENNLLALDANKDFLPPFAEKKRTDGYIGLGKLIEAAVRFAAYTRDDEVLALKRHLVASVTDAQEADGYIGMLAADHRMRGMWDVHEMAYLIYALATDYQHFDEQGSLTSARRAADYIPGTLGRLADGMGQSNGDRHACVGHWFGTRHAQPESVDERPPVP